MAYDRTACQYHQGIRDVAYFTILALDSEQRRTHERDLVDLYVQHLRDHGVSRDETRDEDVWERYRSFSAVDDLDALRLLDRIG